MWQRVWVNCRRTHDWRAFTTANISPSRRCMYGSSHLHLVIVHCPSSWGLRVYSVNQFYWYIDNFFAVCCVVSVLRIRLQPVDRLRFRIDHNETVASDISEVLNGTPLPRLQCAVHHQTTSSRCPHSHRCPSDSYNAAQHSNCELLFSYLTAKKFVMKT